MLQYKEFSAWITIEGTEAKEFSIEVSEDEKKVTCWIASEVGKRFKVHWTDTAVSTATAGRVSVDGISCHSKIIRRRGVTPCSEGFRLSDTEICPYTFSKMEVTDDDALLGSALQGGTGGIELVINKVRIVTHKQPRVSTPRQVPVQRKVHERSKKGLDHQVQFGQSTVREPSTSLKTADIGGPVVTFCFKYRPIDVLRANGIAPQLPREKRKASHGSEEDEGIEIVDVKPEKDEDVLDLSDGETDVEKISALKAKLAALEAKKSKRPVKKVKREEVKREKIVGVFIDLT